MEVKQQSDVWCGHHTDWIFACPQAEKRMHMLKTRKVKESAEMREEMNLKAELDADTVSEMKRNDQIILAWCVARVAPCCLCAFAHVVCIAKLLSTLFVTSMEDICRVKKFALLYKYHAHVHPQHHHKVMHQKRTLSDCYISRMQMCIVAEFFHNLICLSSSSVGWNQSTANTGRNMLRCREHAQSHLHPHAICNHIWDRAARFQSFTRGIYFISPMLSRKQMPP